MLNASRRFRTGQTGFSLLEVLVAFSIMALSLGGLYQSLMGSVRAVDESERMTSAVLIAESVLRSRAAVPADGWRERGADEQGFEWIVVSSPLHDVEAASMPWKLHRVQVSVGWGGRAGRVSLVSYLPEGVPPDPRS